MRIATTAARLFDLRLKMMEQNPTEAEYIELKKAAEAVGTWETVRPTIIHQLEQKKQFETLTRVYLHDRDWDAAWRTLDKVNLTPHPAWMGVPMLESGGR